MKRSNPRWICNNGPEGTTIMIQEHPESPRLRDKYISKLVTEELGFKSSTVHETLLHKK